MDISYVPGLNVDTLQDVPVFESWVLLCCFVPVRELEQSVGHRDEEAGSFLL